MVLGNTGFQGYITEHRLLIIICAAHLPNLSLESYSTPKGYTEHPLHSAKNNEFFNSLLEMISKQVKYVLSHTSLRAQDHLISSTLLRLTAVGAVAHKRGLEDIASKVRSDVRAFEQLYEHTQTVVLKRERWLDLTADVLKAIEDVKLKPYRDGGQVALTSDALDYMGRDLADSEIDAFLSFMRQSI